MNNSKFIKNIKFNNEKNNVKSVNMVSCYFLINDLIRMLFTVTKNRPWKDKKYDVRLKRLFVCIGYHILIECTNINRNKIIKNFIDKLTSNAKAKIIEDYQYNIDGKNVVEYLELLKYVKSEVKKESGEVIIDEEDLSYPMRKCMTEDMKPQTEITSPWFFAEKIVEITQDEQNEQNGFIIEVVNGVRFLSKLFVLFKNQKLPAEKLNLG